MIYMHGVRKSIARHLQPGASDGFLKAAELRQQLPSHQLRGIRPAFTSLGSPITPIYDH